MKKILTCLLCFAVACSAFMLTACDDRDLLDRIAELENKIVELEGNESGGGGNTGDTGGGDTGRIGELEASIQALQTKVTALETAKTTLEGLIATNTGDITTLKTKVEALEGASALYGQRITALETNSDTYATDITGLTKDLSDLTASVVNATKIERVELTKEQADSQEHEYVRGLGAGISKRLDDKINLSASFGFNKTINHQLFCFLVTLNTISESLNFSLYADKSSKSDNFLGSTLNTNIDYSSTYTVIANKLIMYQFS